MTKKRKDAAYIVTRTDNHAGLSVRATSPAAAEKKAQKWTWMRGAPGYVVRPFCADPVTGEAR